jgi:hypothetical protein
MPVLMKFLHVFGVIFVFLMVSSLFSLHFFLLCNIVLFFTFCYRNLAIYSTYVLCNLRLNELDAISIKNSECKLTMHKYILVLYMCDDIVK